MAEEIKIGMNTAAAYGTGAMAVFSTPAMISMMEEASFLLRKKLGYASVGTGVNIKHLRACLPGTEVWAEAVVEDIDRKAVTFSVTAYDSKGEIGKGTHSRFIIDPEKFMKKLSEAK